MYPVVAVVRLYLFYHYQCLYIYYRPAAHISLDKNVAVIQLQLDVLFSDNVQSNVYYLIHYYLDQYTDQVIMRKSKFSKKVSYEVSLHNYFIQQRQLTSE